MERGLRRELCRMTAATLKIRGGVRSGLIRQESRKGCVDTMGVERDIGREPRSDAVRVVYGLTTKGNGEVILSWEKHMSLSIGGGKLGKVIPPYLSLALTSTTNV